METKILKPMTREEWEQLPEAVKAFHPWERARKPLKVQAPPWKQTRIHRLLPPLPSR